MAIKISISKHRKTSSNILRRYIEQSGQPGCTIFTAEAASLEEDEGNDELFTHTIIRIRPDEFLLLGKDASARERALKEMTRQMFSSMDLHKDIRWFAGIHINTETPHIHIAANKVQFD